MRPSLRLRPRLPVTAGKSPPSTTPSVGPLGGPPAASVANQPSAVSLSSRHAVGSSPASISAARVSSSVSRKLTDASRAQGLG